MDHQKYEWSHFFLSQMHFLHFPHMSLTSGLLLHRSSVLIKEQYTMYCNKIFKTTLEVWTLLEHLCDMLQLLKKWITKLRNLEQTVDRSA